MENWLDDVRSLEAEHQAASVAKRRSDREVFEGTEQWLQDQVAPAMRRFAADLRTLGRVAEVRLHENMARVEIRDSAGLTPEFVAEIGTEGRHRTEVRDSLPTMSAVFHGVDRLEVTGERIYELLKESYLSKLKSRPA